MIADIPPSPPVTLYQVQHIYEADGSSGRHKGPTKGVTNDVQAQKTEASGARTIALSDVAINMGLKGGLIWQLTNINNAIKKRERDLDTIYDFGHYMIKDRVVPAVITESRDVYTQDGDFALRLSGVNYTINSQPRFSSVAPSWREYLDFPVPKLDASAIRAFFPKSSEERTAWQLGVDNGWKQGVEQANIMLDYGMNRLNRDFTGMLRFHELVIQGKITMPAIATEAIPLTKSDHSLVLDEHLLRITTLPEFQSNMNHWSTAITPSITSTPTMPAPSPTPQEPPSHD